MGYILSNAMDIRDIARSTAEYAASLEAARSRRSAYFGRLRKASEEYRSLNISETVSFEEWMKTNYGIQIRWDQEDNITEHYGIVNENRHTVFLLKYS